MQLRGSGEGDSGAGKVTAWHRAERRASQGPLGAQRRGDHCGEQEGLWSEACDSRKAKRPKKSVSEPLGRPTPAPAVGASGHVLPSPRPPPPQSLVSSSYSRTVTSSE